KATGHRRSSPATPNSTSRTTPPSPPADPTAAAAGSWSAVPSTWACPRRRSRSTPRPAGTSPSSAPPRSAPTSCTPPSPAGPARGVHLLGWWRGVKRFAEDVGGGSGREDVACLVALNVAANDLGSLVGDHSLDWQPRPNRALLLDRHEQRTALIVPFVRPGRHDEDGALW